MSAPRNTGPRAGYSLVELVAALSIFSIGVVSILTLFTTCLRSTSASMDYTQAVMLAQGALEETIAEGVLLTGADSGDFGDTFPRHAWELEIEEADEPGLLLLTLTVTWEDRGREKEYTLTTLVADKDTTL
ncbi:MAG: prepilin-type N-terminal cleavage/methylation domain-containing protein [Candidatus Hydrogenedentes bacterium]|nr:prepilin-type N-terminal cleavage/methylation domain-containing protein [Candidatus Hydrogenedentota bacterium]